MSNKFISYMCGIGVYGCLMSLFKDIVGKETYINFVNNSWISGYITVPFAIVLLIIFVSLYHSIKE